MLAAHQMKKQGTKQKNGVETALTTVLKTGDRKQMRSRNDRLFEASEPSGALNQNGDSRLTSIWKGPCTKSRDTLNSNKMQFLVCQADACIDNENSIWKGALHQVEGYC